MVLSVMFVIRSLLVGWSSSRPLAGCCGNIVVALLWMRLMFSEVISCFVVSALRGKPLVGWIKANFDGVVRGFDSLAAVGGVLRDAQGSWIYGYARRIGRCSVLMAELWATNDILFAA
ncbi:hypothetical protein V6N12_069366 [Hibiscus sabdariffa]|uniref:RNase H type-1 domain-containing protein n=1 Tax=Hibiscus sabdariffa TaxID=183260 RepID=A0ABR2FDT6_9ROSI